MTDSPILYRVDSHIGCITLNRPKVLNALSTELLVRFAAILDEVEEDDSLRVLIITGSGRAFCAGADVSQMDPEADADFIRHTTEELAQLFKRVRCCRVPTIAAVNGVAVGGGFELALQCDFRLAASTARLGSLEVTMGQPMTNGASALMTRLIGEARAKEIGLLGDLMDATRAWQIGLVNAVAEPAELADLSNQWAEKVVSRAPLAVSLVKQSFERAACGAGIEEIVDFETRSAVTCFLSDDQREGLAAFFEKRDPQFKGK